MIDTKLIAAHQWVIDETQKKPGWWAEQVIMAGTAMEIVRKVVTWDSGWDAVLLFLVLVVAALLVSAARQPILLKSIGTSTWIRPFFLGLTALHLFTLFAEPGKLALNMLELVAALCMLSYYCFAACDDPKPPKRKEKLVPTAA
jgi:hypothetical protein